MLLESDTLGAFGFSLVAPGATILFQPDGVKLPELQVKDLATGDVAVDREQEQQSGQKEQQ